MIVSFQIMSYKTNKKFEIIEILSHTSSTLSFIHSFHAYYAQKWDAFLI